MKNWIKRAIFIIGFLFCLYPAAGNLAARKNQSDVISTYQAAVENVQKDELADVIEQAQKYNSLLYQTQGAVIDQVDMLSEEMYSMQMDLTKTGVMGSLEIPKINVNLPIYHGTSEEVLASGIGHIKGTSLPVGGENTHCVLSGHRGLPGSKLLVRLDEMEENDCFFLSVCGKKLAYKVRSIQVVEPEDVSSLKINAEEDLVSLVTCTPYGINTHRMIVTGERVEYNKSGYGTIEEALPSGRELLFTALPVLFLMAAILIDIRDRGWSKNEKGKKISFRNLHIDNVGGDSGSSQRCRRRKKRINSRMPYRRRRGKSKTGNRIPVYQSCQSGRRGVHSYRDV